MNATTNILPVFNQDLSKFMTMGVEQLIAELRTLRDEQGVTFAEVERKTGVSRSSISQFVNHKRVTESIEKSLRDFLKEYYESESTPDAGIVKEYKQQIELYPTSEFNEVLGFCEDMRLRGKMGVIVGPPGSGKTTALKEYIKRTPGAVYIEAFSSMRMSDLLEAMAQACGTELPRGTSYKKLQHVIRSLKGKNLMFLIDEAEYLKKWDVSKFDDLRKIWDNTGTPILLCGTHELETILTRGNGKDNLAQLYRRKYEIRLQGIKEKEVRMILQDYNMTKEAMDLLVAIAIDFRHGGMGNFVEVLELCLEACGAGLIDGNAVKDAKNYKMLF